MTKGQLRKRIKLLVWFFIIATVLSGVTAFPLEWEVKLLARWAGAFDRAVPGPATGLLYWILTVRDGLIDTYAEYPFIAYGTDWLAFGHIVIALAFIGVLRDPVRNRWIVEWAMIACVLVVPLAMICGPIRGIPFYWRLIDCSFGVFGIIPLWLCRGYIVELDRIGGAKQREHT